MTHIPEPTLEADVVIVGGGPGGISAAFFGALIWVCSVLIDRASQLGGQLLSIFNEITNYPGRTAHDGRELRDNFVEQLTRSSVNVVLNAEVVSADLAARTITLADGRVVVGRALIIATGVSRRRLGIAGEELFAGRGLLSSGALEKDSVKGKSVAIIGGGDAALENALILASRAERVFVVHRSTTFRARQDFLERAHRLDNIEFVTNAAATSIAGAECIEAIETQHVQTGEVRRIPVGALLVRIGFGPNTSLFEGQLVLDAAGYIKVDSCGATGVDGVFAVGDVASPLAPTISGAVGSGATAAKVIENRER